jgi:predicted RNA-binding Zn-ribbon protein involved in translation (DUF1610 family)
MSNDNPYEPPQTDTEAVEAKFACPKCGAAMEKGVIQSLGNITWYAEMSSFKISVPERLSPKGLNLESKIPAVKCPDCKTITVEFPSD